MRHQFLVQIFEKNRESRKRAVFIDRDGTLIQDVNYLSRKHDIKIFPEAPRFVQKFNQQGYLVIVVSNQAAIARGLIDEAKLKEINYIIYKKFKKSGAQLAAFYCCPHHPRAFVSKYRQICQCRKPGTQMYLQAAQDLQLDIRKSLVIGDQTTDIKAGENLGIPAFIVKTGYSSKDGRHVLKFSQVTQKLQSVTAGIMNQTGPSFLVDNKI